MGGHLFRQGNIDAYDLRGFQDRLTHKADGYLPVSLSFCLRHHRPTGQKDLFSNGIFLTCQSSHERAIIIPICMKKWFLACFAFLYRSLVRRVLFLIPSETIHEILTTAGETMGKLPLVPELMKRFF